MSNKPRNQITCPLAMPATMYETISEVARLTGLSRCEVMRQGIRMGLPFVVRGLNVQIVLPTLYVSPESNTDGDVRSDNLTRGGQ